MAAVLCDGRVDVLAQMVGGLPMILTQATRHRSAGGVHGQLATAAGVA